MGDEPIKERLFVEAYLSSAGNGTEAARRAGYRGSDKVLGIQAVRLLGKARVQEALRARTERAIAAVGGPTPEDIIANLDEVRRGGPWFRVDSRTGEPIIDLRTLEAAGKLHLVKRVTRTSTTRTIPGKQGAHDIQETTKTLGVELYSSQEAAATLGRFLGMDKSRPEQPSALADARAFVVAVLESGDKEARAALDTLARKMYPGPASTGDARRWGPRGPLLGPPAKETDSSE